MTAEDAYRQAHGRLTEEELLAGGSIPLQVLLSPELQATLDAIAGQLTRILELQETLLGIATGEVQVFHGQVDIVGADGLWPPAEPTP